MRQKTHILVICLIIAATAISSTASQAAGNSTVRASESVSGQEGNIDSFNAAISADGQFVAFDSSADSLVLDLDNIKDVFVKDLNTSLLSRVSTDSNGTPGNNDSSDPAISRDGRYVAFVSSADNLVAGDTNNVRDIFVHDRVTHTTTRASLAWDGAQANADAYAPSISDDGRYVAFESDASNLVPDDTNALTDIFVRDLQNNETVRASVGRNGLIILQANGASFGPVISADGSLVVYSSYASNLVSGDTNGSWDVFLSMPQLALTDRVSIASNGAEGNGDSFQAAMSGNGRFIAFSSTANNLVPSDTNLATDIFVRDTMNNTTIRVSLASNGGEGTSSSGSPSISDDGRCVAFESYASNLVANDTNFLADVFVRDLAAGVTFRASVASNGAQSNGSSRYPVISADGHFVAFESGADNLISNDTNSSFDIFRRAVIETAIIRSVGNQDGWVLETGENTSLGGTLNSADTTFRLGDDPLKRQYRSVLSFATGAALPDNAVIVKATLRLRRQGIVGGGNPVTAFQGFMADIRKGTFGTAALQATDWQASANKTVGPFTSALTSGWYSMDLTSAQNVINKLAAGGGLTHIRLRFKLDDNNNAIANYLSLYSGNAPAASRPQLIIEYYVP